MEARNPVFTRDGRIDCEINHPVYGWIPFTADENDAEPFGRLAYATLFEAGPAPHQEPAHEEVTAFIPPLSFAQLISGLVNEGWITRAEGKAWIRGVLPAQVEALINSLPVEQQMLAEARAVAPASINRLDPLVVALGTIQGRSAEDLNAFFIKHYNT